MPASLWSSSFWKSAFDDISIMAMRSRYWAIAMRSHTWRHADELVHHGRHHDDARTDLAEMLVWRVYVVGLHAADRRLAAIGVLSLLAVLHQVERPHRPAGVVALRTTKQCTTRSVFRSGASRDRTLVRIELAIDSLERYGRRMQLEVNRDDFHETRTVETTG